MFSFIPSLFSFVVCRYSAILDCNFPRLHLILSPPPLLTPPHPTPVVSTVLDTKPSQGVVLSPLGPIVCPPPPVALFPSDVPTFNALLLEGGGFLLGFFIIIFNKSFLALHFPCSFSSSSACFWLYFLHILFVGRVECGGASFYRLYFAHAVILLLLLPPPFFPPSLDLGGGGGKGLERWVVLFFFAYVGLPFGSGIYLSFVLLNKGEKYGQKNESNLDYRFFFLIFFACVEGGEGRGEKAPFMKRRGSEQKIFPLIPLRWGFFSLSSLLTSFHPPPLRIGQRFLLLDLSLWQTVAPTTKKITFFWFLLFKK